MKEGLAILVFVRVPELGRVKTRLAAGVGEAAALEVYRRLAEHTLERARQVAGGARICICYTPDDAGAVVAGWLGEDERTSFHPQGEGDLGTRMEGAFARAFAHGHQRVVIVGSDLPAMTAELLERASAALDERDAVLGPARDGGYYLLGLRRLITSLFREVPWSGPRVLKVTLDRLREDGVEPWLLEPLSDVDTAEDLPAGWSG